MGGGTATESNELAIKVVLDGCHGNILAFDNAHHGNSDLTNSSLYRTEFP